MIEVGQAIPDVSVHVMGDKGPEAISSATLFAGQKVVLFAVPGAFTPGCSLTHLPGYVVKADVIKARGVDRIICMAVNDAFVMDAWGKSQNAQEITMVGDGNAELTRALGLTLDAQAYGMGTRSQRFALIAEDGVVTHLAVEPAGGITVSSAESVLDQL
ncbi:redoxin domain-containing protein [Oceanococcus atlanticus]|uniref:Glutathione-dependent peroxiredoxin n=1 Tax=Oceanococcus atlanticus TaxID=1317117 RepID=A0A1Y1SFR3_9GAMM|nr:peroxiredoxin [Oceanococcus atlanticus]ORE88487.1 redoxin domain-containing protein [Oceanococcus atlanticus]